MSLGTNNPFPLDFGDFVGSYAKQVHSALDAIENQWGAIYQAMTLIKQCKGTVWLIGNGGSASLASHMATDLQLAGVRAIALTDVAAITTYSNDQRFSRCFSQQLLRLAQVGDVLIAISGSGNSANILTAIENVDSQAMRKLKVIAITGFEGGAMGAADYALHINIPSNHMGVSQDGHQVVLHMICYYLMQGEV